MRAHQSRAFAIRLSFLVFGWAFGTVLVLSHSVRGALPDHHISDSDITIAIESRFLVDKSIPAHHIDVETKKGIVTLSGRVTTMLAKDRAGKIVESVRGVTAIINIVQVDPGTHTNDQQLLKKIKTALADDPAADSYELHVSVDSGQVILTGIVESWAEKQLSEEVVKSVKGVNQLSNHITVSPSPIRPDSEIEAEILRRLQSDVWVHEKLIGVMVDQGHVSLVGTVGSLEEKYVAYTDAWVLGTKSVNVEQLNVKWWAQDRMLRDPNETVTSSTRQAQAIQTAFSYHPRLKASQLAIDVDEGTAVLSGIVDNAAAKRAAEQTARNTVGIWRVKNHIKVRPPEHLNDQKLKQRVIKALQENPIIDRYAINVISTNGIISVEGYLNSPTAIAQAVSTVAKVKGVAKVVNNLQYDHPDIPESDEELWEDIRQGFWWDSHLHDHPIHVDVDRGVVTLEGTVPSILEWRRAAEIAKTSGAKRVLNRLKVKFGPDFLAG